jgi:ATP-dependent 26S proteasome regulatory subunit
MDGRKSTLNLEFGLTVGQEKDLNALRLAKLLPGFSAQDFSSGRGRVSLGLEEASGLRDVLLDLWELVKSNPGAQILLDKQRIELDDFKQVLRVLDCAKAYEAANIGERYCHSIQWGWDWGCLFLAQVSPLAGQGKDGLDRSLLKDVLSREAENLHLNLCPYFDLAKALAKADTISEETLASLDQNSAGVRPRKRLSSLVSTQENTAPQRPLPSTTFADVGGLDEVVLTLRETIELPIRHPEVLRYLGVTPHRGVLLHGEPGCGKTLLARALANECGARFFPISGPELITKWHGESEEKLRQLFEQAQEAQPSIIFFDEIDAIAQARSSSESLRLDARFTAQLLTLMDGIYDLGRVFILAASNRPDLLDKALLRPGRFDLVVEIPKPNREGRLKILEIHTRKLPLVKDLDLKKMAGKLSGLTGADIAYVAREAAYVCLRKAIPLNGLLAQAEAFQVEALRGLLVTEQDMLYALQKLRARKRTVLKNRDEGTEAASDAGAGSSL